MKFLDLSTGGFFFNDCRGSLCTRPTCYVWDNCGYCNEVHSIRVILKLSTVIDCTGMCSFEAMYNDCTYVLSRVVEIERGRDRELQCKEINPVDTQSYKSHTKALCERVKKTQLYILVEKTRSNKSGSVPRLVVCVFLFCFPGKSHHSIYRRKQRSVDKAFPAVTLLLVLVIQGAKNTQDVYQVWCWTGICLCAG